MKNIKALMALAVVSLFVVGAFATISDSDGVAVDDSKQAGNSAVLLTQSASNKEISIVYGTGVVQIGTFDTGTMTITITYSAQSIDFYSTGWLIDGNVFVKTYEDTSVDNPVTVTLQEFPSSWSIATTLSSEPYAPADYDSSISFGVAIAASILVALLVVIVYLYRVC